MSKLLWFEMGEDYAESIYERFLKSGYDLLRKSDLKKKRPELGIQTKFDRIVIGPEKRVITLEDCVTRLKQNNFAETKYLLNILKLYNAEVEFYADTENNKTNLEELGLQIVKFDDLLHPTLNEILCYYEFSHLLKTEAYWDKERKIFEVDTLYSEGKLSYPAYEQIMFELGN